MAKSPLESYQEMKQKQAEHDAALNEFIPVGQVSSDPRGENYSYDEALAEAIKAQKILKLKEQEAKVNEKARKLNDNKFSDFNLSDPTNDDNYDDVISRFLSPRMGGQSVLPKAYSDKLLSNEVVYNESDLENLKNEELKNRPLAILDTLNTSLDQVSGPKINTFKNAEPSVVPAVEAQVKVSKGLAPTKPIVPKPDLSEIPKVGSFSGTPSKEELATIPKVGSFTEQTPVVDKVATTQAAPMSDEERLDEAKRQRDIMAAMGLISGGLSKAAAGYGGGSVTQLKPDTTAQDVLTQMGERGVADVKEMMAGKTEKEKQRIENLLKQAQVAKMNFEASGKMTDKEKADDRYKRALLALEGRKLDIEAGKLVNPKLTMDEVKQRAENRKTLKEVNTDETKIQQLIKQIDDAQKTFNEYSKKSLGGTGLAAQAKGYLGSMAPETQKLESKFNALGLDTLVKTFSGMSKAVDTDAERAYFQSTQPNLKNDDIVNKEILANMKDRAVSMLNKYKATKAMYNRDGTFNENPVEPKTQEVKPESSVGPYGQEVERNGKAYIWNPSVGKYQLK